MLELVVTFVIFTRSQFVRKNNTSIRREFTIRDLQNEMQVLVLQGMRIPPFSPQLFSRRDRDFHTGLVRPINLQISNVTSRRIIHRRRLFVLPPTIRERLIMPIWITHALNNTSHGLNYWWHHAQRSEEAFSHVPARRPNDNPDLLPSSPYHPQEVPFKQNTPIKVWFTDERDDNTIKIADDNYKFSITGKVAEHPTQMASRRYGTLKDGGSYILRFDEVYYGAHKRCLVTIYEYEDRCKPKDGSVRIDDIEYAVVTVGMVMMAPFDCYGSM